MANGQYFRKEIIWWAGLGGLVVLALIYLTPLKHINLLEPWVNDIEPRDFYALYQAQPDDYIFIDVRSPSEYDRIHVPGSINIPLHVLYDERTRLPKQGKEIVLICSGGRASGVAYGYLEHHGFLNLKRVSGGIEQWSKDNLPVIVK